MSSFSPSNLSGSFMANFGAEEVLQCRPFSCLASFSTGAWLHPWVSSKHHRYFFFRTLLFTGIPVVVVCPVVAKVGRVGGCDGVLPLQKGVEIPVTWSCGGGGPFASSAIHSRTAGRVPRAWDLFLHVLKTFLPLRSDARACASAMPSSIAEKKLSTFPHRVPRFVPFNVFVSFLSRCSFRLGGNPGSFLSIGGVAVHVVVVQRGATDVTTPTKRNTRAHQTRHVGTLRPCHHRLLAGRTPVRAREERVGSTSKRTWKGTS